VASIGSITALTCEENIGQVQKLIFQRTYNGTAVNSLGTTSTVITLQTWTTLLAAADDTKVEVTPYIAAHTTEPGKAKEFGSGNEVRNGIPIVFGTDPTKVSCRIYGPTSKLIRELKAMECEVLSVAMINELGWLAGKYLTSTGGLPSDAPGASDLFMGFPMQQFHVSDLILGGLDGPDYIEMSWSFAAGWSDYKCIVKPTAFNGLDIA
jgi:hypothetical protein